jgi:fucose permease
MGRREGRASPGAASLALSGAFVGMGLSGALPSAILPVLARQTGLSPEAASLVVSGVFAGLFLGVTAAALAWAAIPPVRMLRAGAWLQAGGLLLMAQDAGPQEVVGGAVVLGVGFGITELSATAVVRGLEAVTGLDLTRRTSLVALTAALTPVLLGLLVAIGYWRPLFVAAAALHLLIAVALDDGESVPPAPPTSWRRAARPRKHHLIVAAYVGGETLLVAWFTRIAGTSLRLGVGPTVAATAAFWVAIAAGRRVASPLHLAAMPARRLLAATLVLAIAALAIAAATDGVPRAVALFVALAGAGPVYPLVLATAPGAKDARVLAPLIAAGSLGGTLVTGIGTMAYRSAGQPGVLLLAAGALAVCLLAGGSWRPEAWGGPDERFSL